MFETSIDSNKMNNHKVDFVICCDINDSETVHCNDKGISLLAVSPVREYFIDALDNSDVSTDIVKTPPSTQNSDTGPGDTQDTAKDQGTVSRVFMDCMKAEQQTILLRTLKMNKVGTNQVENQVKGQVKARKLKKNRKTK